MYDIQNAVQICIDNYNYEMIKYFFNNGAILNDSILEYFFSRGYIYRQIKDRQTDKLIDRQTNRQTGKLK